MKYLFKTFDSYQLGIRSRINREVSVFKKLSQGSRLLLVCSALFWLANPLISLFLNIFLWRETADLQSIALFNLFIYLSLPIGFIVNGFLFRKISRKKIFQIAMLLQGIFPLFLIILREKAFKYLFPLGFLKGLSASFYWANLNLLIYNLTSDKVRGYFTGLDATFASLVGIVASPFAGLVISSIGPKWFSLSLQGSYYLAFLLAGFIFVLAAFVAKGIVDEGEKLEFSFKSVSLKNKSRKWHYVRLLNVVSGFYWGFMMFSFGLLAFRFFGKELNVGWFNGLLSLVYALIGYVAGRLAWPERRIPVAFVGTIFYFFGYLFFAALFSLIGLFVFSIMTAFGDILMWTAHRPVEMREMDQGFLPKEKKYDYIVDIEIWLNFGRILGIGVLIILNHFFDFDSLYRVMMFIIAFAPFVSLKAIKDLVED